VNDNNLATQRPFHPTAGTFLTGCGKKELVIPRASDKHALVPFQDSSPWSNGVRFTPVGRKASAFLGPEEIDFLPLPPRSFL